MLIHFSLKTRRGSGIAMALASVLYAGKCVLLILCFDINEAHAVLEPYWTQMSYIELEPIRRAGTWNLRATLAKHISGCPPQACPFSSPFPEPTFPVEVPAIWQQAAAGLGLNYTVCHQSSVVSHRAEAHLSVSMLRRLCFRT